MHFDRDSLQRFLLYLPDLRTLADGPPTGGTDSPLRSRRRAALLAALWDVERAIESLPTHLRQAVFVRYERGWTERRAAEALHIAQRSLCTRLLTAEVRILRFLRHDANTDG